MRSEENLDDLMANLFLAVMLLPWHLAYEPCVLDDLGFASSAFCWSYNDSGCSVRRVCIHMEEEDWRSPILAVFLHSLVYVDAVLLYRFANRLTG